MLEEPAERLTLIDGEPAKPEWVNQAAALVIATDVYHTIRKKLAFDLNAEVRASITHARNHGTIPVRAKPNSPNIVTSRACGDEDGARPGVGPHGPDFDFERSAERGPEADRNAELRPQGASLMNLRSEPSRDQPRALHFGTCNKLTEGNAGCRGGDGLGGDVGRCSGADSPAQSIGSSTPRLPRPPTWDDLCGAEAQHSSDPQPSTPRVLQASE